MCVRWLDPYSLLTPYYCGLILLSFQPIPYLIGHSCAQYCFTYLNWFCLPDNPWCCNQTNNHKQTNKQTNKNIQTFSSAFLAHDGVILAHRTLDDDQVHLVRATRIVCGPFKFLFSGCCSWFTWLIYYCILLPFSPLFVAPKRSRDRLPLRAEDFSCNFKITRLRCSGDPNNVFPQVF